MFELRTSHLFNWYDIRLNFCICSFWLLKEKTASEVAQAVLSSIYGKKSISKQKPFEITFDSEYNVWVISGKLKSNMIGGVATIIIQKNNGEVLAVSHSK